MSEPSGDSPNTPPSSEPEPTGAGASPNNLARAPRAKPPNVNSSKEVPPTGSPPGFSEFMTWMKMMGEGNAVDHDASQPGRGVLPKEQKKFSRRTTEPPASSPSPDVRSMAPGIAPPSPPQAERTSPGTPVNVPPDFLNVERKRRSRDTSNKSPVLTLLTQFLVFAAIVGSFFVGRATLSKQAMVPVAAAGAPVASKDARSSGLLPPELLAKVDDATAAEASGDNARAMELLQSVKDSGGQLAGLNFHQAVLAYAAGDFPKVLPLLNLSIAEGNEVAACYNLRGSLTNRQGGGLKGIPDLELASNLDPFNARYAFFTGEALRRAGKPQAALVFLRQALHRLREPMSEGLYMLKIRLAQLEIGQQDDFAAETAAMLVQKPPPLDWVLTAAAVELHRGNIPAAKGYFEQAKSLAPERDLLIRLRDFYFYSFAHEKELAPFFAPINAAATVAPTPAASVGFNPGATPTALNTPVTPLLDTTDPVTLLKKP